jgi:ubiquinone/menaquinone biosynthesis C-methylase UbiE
MSEPSIQRARRSDQSLVPFEKATFSALPLDDCQFDTVFLIFVAHELRKSDVRLRFLRETNRVLKPGGKLVLVEHIRDWKNLLAYGPGALHFFSRNQWSTLCQKAGFCDADEVGITPFVEAADQQPCPPICAAAL